MILQNYDFPSIFPTCRAIFFSSYGCGGLAGDAGGRQRRQGQGRRGGVRRRSLGRRSIVAASRPVRSREGSAGRSLPQRRPASIKCAPSAGFDPREHVRFSAAGRSFRRQRPACGVPSQAASRTVRSCKRSAAALGRRAASRERSSQAAPLGCGQRGNRMYVRYGPMAQPSAARRLPLAKARNYMSACAPQASTRVEMRATARRAAASPLRRPAARSRLAACASPAAPRTMPLRLGCRCASSDSTSRPLRRALSKNRLETPRHSS